MTTVVKTEKRKRGFFGFIFKWLFVIFQLLMIFWLLSALVGVGDVANQATSDAERAGVGIGAAIGFTYLLFIWALGTIIFGAFAALTRGKKIIVEEVVS